MASEGACQIRTITEAELEQFATQLTRGFGGDLLPPKERSDFRQILELDRVFAAFDGNHIAGTCAAFSLDLTVPGGTLPMGGTTMVTVQPTHRRRGLLREMMRAHLEEVRGRGDPLAGLWCSESSIYRQFGFGSAVELCEMTANTHHVHFVGDPAGRTLRYLEPAEAKQRLPEIYDRVRLRRPGMFSRSPGWWEQQNFRDHASERAGLTEKRFLVCEGEEGLDGYAIYRQREKWPDFPESQIHVEELFATSSEAHEALWRLLMNVDLYPKVQHWNMAVDDELAWRVSDPRRIQRTVRDSLWLRPLDIPRTLAGRAYSQDGRCVLGIRDAFLPENDGCYELHVSGDTRECTRTQAEAEVSCGVDALGAIFLGGHRASTLARAGRIRGDEPSLALLDRMFAWSPMPWCPEVF